MMPNYAVVNQYFMTGCQAAQQAAMIEASGNVMMAAQGYDQAIAWIEQSANLAMQSGIPIPDSVYFTHTLAQFNAARMKYAMGMAPMAWNHLSMALQSVNQAIQLNPRMFQYHTAAGTILIAMGNAPEAQRALMTALQLNPMDQGARAMLNALQSQMGQAGMTPAQPMPQMPGVPTSGMTGNMMGVAPGGGGQAPGPAHNSLQTMNDWLGTADKLFNTIGDFGKMMQQFGGGGFSSS